MLQRFATITTAAVLAVGLAACASGGYNVGIGTSQGSSYPHPGHHPGHHVGHPPGPPAHAKAYGYRAKHKNKHFGRHYYRRGGRHAAGGSSVEIVYDGSLGVYVVIDHPHHYYHDGRYLRRSGGVWQMSAEFDGLWVTAGGSIVPTSLRAKY